MAKGFRNAHFKLTVDRKSVCHCQGKDIECAKAFALAYEALTGLDVELWIYRGVSHKEEWLGFRNWDLLSHRPE